MFQIVGPKVGGSGAGDAAAVGIEGIAPTYARSLGRQGEGQPAGGEGGGAPEGEGGEAEEEEEEEDGRRRQWRRQWRRRGNGCRGERAGRDTHGVVGPAAGESCNFDPSQPPTSSSSCYTVSMQNLFGGSGTGTATVPNDARTSFSRVRALVLGVESLGLRVLRLDLNDAGVCAPLDVRPGSARAPSPPRLRRRSPPLFLVAVRLRVASFRPPLATPSPSSAVVVFGRPPPAPTPAAAATP